MSVLLVQEPDSKVFHRAIDERLRPLCKVDERADSSLRWRVKGSRRYTRLTWRTPRGVCCNCSALVEQAVRLIAAEESR